MIELIVIGILVFIVGVAGLIAVVVGITLAKRKVRKEFGLWKRHRAFRPRPPSRERKLE